ncbi:MAG: formimidoylglutamase [Flavobacteriales bacterium]|nr:formimidoylglutamase [Flavobacteriales bacterium]
MIKEFLTPVKDDVLEFAKSLPETSIGFNLLKHSTNDFPDLDGIKLALIFVEEGRSAVGNAETGNGFDIIRKYFYKLFRGAWDIKIADLGNLQSGFEVEDTYSALKEISSYLIRKQIIPIVIGGGQDLTYASYRAYDSLEQTVNLVSVDSKFDFGNVDGKLDSSSFLSHIILGQPNNLFNFSNIGYQTFFNSQEEIDLMEQLYFDALRIGNVSKEISTVEPILRDADIVSIDIGSVRNSEAPGNRNATPNGFYGEEVCAITRYAGISDKVTSFGIYEYNPILDSEGQTAHLIAQMIWYFVEGVSYRADDYPFCTKENYYKYIVPVEDEELYFYKSNKTDRWWLDVPFPDGANAEFTRHALIPCSYDDYLNAADQEIPDRWWKAFRKLL